MSTTQERRTAAGLCIDCAKPLNGYPHRRCAACSAIHREYNNGRMQMLGVLHRCKRCGKQMPKDWYYIYCEACKEIGNGRQRRRKQHELGNSDAENGAGLVHNLRQAEQ